MYLMYYLNEDGKRVYTLKVRKLYISHRYLCECVAKARFCLVFFSLCWNTQNNINFDREFIITKFTPRRPLIFYLMLDRKRVRMGNRRCRRTRRDSPRTTSSLNRESRAKNGSGYFSRSNRRNSFKSSKSKI